MPDRISMVMEIIGAVAFAVSGALTAVERKMDVLGVIILGVMTAVGGGVLRDVLIGSTPPQAFLHPTYLIIATVTAAAVFLPFIRRRLTARHRILEQLLLVMDSIGLAVATVQGVRTGLAEAPEGGWILAAFLGVISGVGGGVMRDLMAGDTPMIFVKHFYATASVIGAVLCCALWEPCGELIAMASGAAVIFVLRLLAARYHWELPKA